MSLQELNKKKELGQVFTRQEEVDFLISLRQNQGRCLEPSAGDGAIWNSIPDCVGIELDPTVCPDGCANMDFFAYPTTEKFDTIIGNMPYVKGKAVYPSTRALLSNDVVSIKGNLYLHFIEKCLRHLNDGGEMIFLNPLDFMSVTSGEKLVNLLMELGTITHFYDHSGRNIFSNANPDNVCVWRYQKDKFDRIADTNEGNKKILHHRGKLYFTNNQYNVPFSDLFYIKVGAVPGQKDTFFGDGPDSIDFVYSKTRTTGELRRMQYRPREWIRSRPNQDDRDRPRIYVNSKTLTPSPFFINECPDWDGAVLAIFPRFEVDDLQQLVDVFNAVDWADIGFMWHGKYVFTHGALTKCLLPPIFAQYCSCFEDMDVL